MLYLPLRSYTPMGEVWVSQLWRRKLKTIFEGA